MIDNEGPSPFDLDGTRLVIGLMRAAACGFNNGLLIPASNSSINAVELVAQALSRGFEGAPPVGAVVHVAGWVSPVAMP
jgi:hypothetical protein